MATFSLSAAGIGYRPPFVRADDVAARPFMIVHAEINPNGYGGRPELYAVLEIIPDEYHGPALYDEDGNAINRVAWTAALTSSREQIARFFAGHPGDQLGPCQFHFVPGQGDKPFASLVDYVPPISGQIVAPAPQQRAVQRQQPQQQQRAAQRPQQRPQQPTRHPAGVVNNRGVVVPDDADLEELPH